VTQTSSISDAVVKILEEKKACDVITFDLSSCQTKISDTCIIASGTSSRHLQSVADHVYRYLKCKHLHPHMEGKAESGWIIVESHGCEIHLFKPELRAYYALEELLRSGLVLYSHNLINT
jgi:ribosome-associated protein